MTLAPYELEQANRIIAESITTTNYLTALFRLDIPNCYSTTTCCTPAMAPSRCLVALARSRPFLSPAATLLSSSAYTPSSVASFATSAPRCATPSGPPPKGFRLGRVERWDEGKESSLDKAGKYFLLAEMMRGMYVVLEQFFRPP